MGLLFFISNTTPYLTQLPNFAWNDPKWCSVKGVLGLGPQVSRRQLCSQLNKSHDVHAVSPLEKAAEKVIKNELCACLSAVPFIWGEQTVPCINKHTWLHVIEYLACLLVDPNHAFVLAHRIDYSYSRLFHVCLCLI